MGSVNSRDGKLYLDFRFKGMRCREQTRLAESTANRIKLERVLKIIEQQISLNTFDYAHHFPDSPRVAKFRQIAQLEAQKTQGATMQFSVFAQQWQAEKNVEWRLSQQETVDGILRCHLLPCFGDMPVGAINKGDILQFRLKLNDAGLSPSRINHIMTSLRMILNEAADRFDYESPWRNIKPLPIPRADVQPFTLDEVQLILNSVRADFRPYYTVRFFTGMRTGEIDGLTWDKVDFANRRIEISQALVKGVLGPTKTGGSVRSIQMSQRVYDALLTQRQRSSASEQFVFAARNGQPLNHKNVTRRVWYPLLKHLELEARNPYQTRHTAATLWLAAGESPEWIANQLGHANTTMLFKVYSRYVPNLVRRDGSAFESLLDEQFDVNDEEDAA